MLYACSIHATVAEYEEDELADGSDDEKRLYKVELRAGKKVKAGKANKNLLIGKIGHLGSLDGSLQTLLPRRCHLNHPPLVWLSLLPWGDKAQNNTLGPCFECGNMGHLKSSCPDFPLKNLMSKQMK